MLTFGPVHLWQCLTGFLIGVKTLCYVAVKAPLVYSNPLI